MPGQPKLAAVIPGDLARHGSIAVRDYAQAAEDLGIETLLTLEHVLGAVRSGRQRPIKGGPYDERTEFFEPFVLFAYLAGTTDRVRFMSGVIGLPQRQTALVAKQSAEVDLLSGGRFSLGIGAGWNHVEFEGMGADFARRGDRLDEQVEVLRALWREPVVACTGAFHTIDRAGIAPRPGRPIPVLFGGRSAPAFERATRIGDGYIFAWSDDQTVEAIHEIPGRLDAAGRSGQTFTTVAMIDYAEGPDAWSERLDVLAEAGASLMAIRAEDATAAHRGLPPHGLRTVDRHIHAVREFCTIAG